MSFYYPILWYRSHPERTCHGRNDKAKPLPHLHLVAVECSVFFYLHDIQLGITSVGKRSHQPDGYQRERTKQSNAFGLFNAIGAYSETVQTINLQGEDVME